MFLNQKDILSQNNMNLIYFILFVIQMKNYLLYLLSNLQSIYYYYYYYFLFIYYFLSFSFLIPSINIFSFKKKKSDIASGMASIQELGIIHHDLKSANVLLEQVEISPGQYVLNGFFLFLFSLFLFLFFHSFHHISKCFTI